MTTSRRAENTPQATAPIGRLAVRRGGAAYNERVVFQGLSFDWSRGSLHLVYGVGGAGKSTLLTVLAGARRHHGALRVWGDWCADGRRLGDAGWPELIHQRISSSGARVCDELASACAERGSVPMAELRTRILEQLAAFGLADIFARTWMEPVFRLPMELRQVLALARGILCSPPALLADELTAHCSAPVRALVLRALEQLAASRVVALATHDVRHVSETAAQSWLLGPRPADLPLTPKSLAAREPEQPLGLRFRAPSQLVWVKPRRLGGMPRPGLLEDLSLSLSTLAAQGVRLLVNLEETLHYPPEAVARHGLRLLHLPMPDMGVPPDVSAFERVLDESWLAYQQGECIVVHCKAGLGRTGLMLAALIARIEQIPPMVALEHIRRVQPLFVQSEAQWEFLRMLGST
ncbi:MAG: ATP-binding cassette domain-containing protein [Casimicrobiaceae bacterium]